ncbi:receptor-like cytosolic serine/threonine-protein kinase RBK2 isoform X2 [Salvia splendens]|uniref:receptor-like cytosolic serine/threonine-protein kinase RBK2 isoform X2 n=1 Tax=Salvia splendens TaxID=180675 RepID=UPI001C268C31|nr:receptor-like cytosolic serine/threonine-protein kinase RBK2 isoform X2 [Salvia splendens]
MADQKTQEIVPIRRKHAKNPSIGTPAYQKFAFSFPCSTSAQDLRAYETEQKDTSKEAVKYETETETETEAEEKPPIKKCGSKTSWGWRRFVKLWKKSPIKRIPVPKVVSRRKSRISRQNSFDIDNSPFKYTWKTFTYPQLKTATNNFSPDSDTKLEWSKRYKIMLGVAEGLHYLHECCERRIIHRDIKADNVLLSEDFEPQICDFGLSKWLPKHWSHHNATKFEGTFGYFAPEYFMHGIVDEKIDIFSFGVLLLELITGREAIDESKNSLVLWAKPLLDKNAVEELVDPSLENEYVAEQMGWVISTANLCIQESPVLRPQMHQVIELLRGESNEKRGSPKGKKKQSSHQRTYSEELSYVDEYNSTKCLIHPNNKHDNFQ